MNFSSFLKHILPKPSDSLIAISIRYVLTLAPECGVPSGTAAPDRTRTTDAPGRAGLPRRADAPPPPTRATPAHPQGSSSRTHTASAHHPPGKNITNN